MKRENPDTKGEVVIARTWRIYIGRRGGLSGKSGLLRLLHRGYMQIKWSLVGLIWWL